LRITTSSSRNPRSRAARLASVNSTAPAVAPGAEAEDAEAADSPSLPDEQPRDARSSVAQAAASVERFIAGSASQGVSCAEHPKLVERKRYSDSTRDRLRTLLRRCASFKCPCNSGVGARGSARLGRAGGRSGASSASGAEKSLTRRRG